MPPILNQHKRKRASSAAADDGPPRKLNPSPKERTPFGKIQSLKRKRETITEIEYAPEDWDANELDLHEHDIDGQIERCHERLEAKIMPQIFRRRLRAYTIAKQRRDALYESEPSGLSLQVVQRLHDLKAIEKALEQRDLWKQLPNVQSLMEAYRSKKLIWKEGFVTYWSRGSQICKPKQFKWKDFEKVNREFNGYKGFWVEGLHDPGPASLNAFITIPPFNPNWYTHTLKIHVRVPTGEIDKQPRPVVLDFLDDTGSQFMHLYEDDLDLIHHSAGRFAPSLGVVNGSSAAGWLQLPTVELEAQIWSDDDKPMTEWVKVQSTVQQGSVQSNGNHRLSGIWVRHVLYTATAPDNQGELMLSTGKTHLNSLPVVRPVKGASAAIETPARNFVPPASVGQLSRTGTPQPGDVGAPYAHSIFPGTPLPAEPQPSSKRQRMTAVEVPSTTSFRGRLQNLFSGASDPRPASHSTIYPRSSESSKSSISPNVASSTSPILSPNEDDSDEKDMIDVDEVEFERDIGVDDEEEEEEEEDGGEGEEEEEESEEESEEEEEMVHHKSDGEDSDSDPEDNEQDEETDGEEDSEDSEDEDPVVSGRAGEEGAMDVDDSNNTGSSNSDSDSYDWASSAATMGDDEERNGAEDWDESTEYVGTQSWRYLDSDFPDSEGSLESDDSDSDSSNSDSEKIEVEDAEDSSDSDSDSSETSEDPGEVDVKVEDAEESQDVKVKIEDPDSSDSEEVAVKVEDANESDNSDSDSSDSEDSEDVDIKVDKSDSSDSESSDSDSSGSEDSEDVNGKVDGSDSSDSEDSDDVDMNDAQDVEGSDDSDSEDSEDDDAKNNDNDAQEPDSSDSGDDGDVDEDAQGASGSESSDEADDEDSGDEEDNQKKGEDLEEEGRSSGEDFETRMARLSGLLMARPARS